MPTHHHDNVVAVPSASKQFPQKCSPPLSFGLRYSSSLEGDRQHFVICCLSPRGRGMESQCSFLHAVRLPLAPFVSSVESGSSYPALVPLLMEWNLTICSQPYSASKAATDFTMRHECLPPLTKNPQRGKEAGWNTCHSAVRPSIVRRTEAGVNPSAL